QPDKKGLFPASDDSFGFGLITPRGFFHIVSCTPRDAGLVRYCTRLGRACLALISRPRVYDGACRGIVAIASECPVSRRQLHDPVPDPTLDVRVPSGLFSEHDSREVAPDI